MGVSLLDGILYRRRPVDLISFCLFPIPAQSRMSHSIPRNAVVLVIDRLGANMLGAYGSTWFETHNFNRLAARSLVFDQAITRTTDIAAAYQGLLEPVPGDNLLKRIGDAGISSILLTDEPKLSSLSASAGFDRIVPIESISSGGVAPTLDQTDLASFFAQATVQAITKFQREQVGLRRPDQRIDVGGKTWKKLVQVVGGAVPKPKTPISQVTLTVSHGGRVPTGTNRASGQPTGTYDGPYESSFVLSGGLTGSFRGSIWPNDMTQRGHLIDGSYPLHIGFHKGGKAKKQDASNLVVKTSGIRAALLVNMRKSVAVSSDKASKKTASGVNIHNGLTSKKRSSDGCPNILPSDWSRFIKLFLDAYPSINDWHAEYTNTGKKVGTLIIRS